jgi:hypothetical protein
MKALLNSFRITLILLSAIGLYSCENKNIDSTGSGTIEFSVNMPDPGTKSLTDSVNVSFHILISVEDIDSNAVITDKMIPLYVFGSGFISENIEIKAGEYLLTKFMVVNASGEVIFAAPRAGSPLAYLSTKPLPVSFNIYPNQLTTIIPEVLTVGDQTPDKFGYANFGVQIIRPLDFWVMCVLDPGNPMIMAPIQITTAKLTVYAPDGWYYSFRLQAAVNHIVIRGGYELYTFILQKEGYLPQKLQFTAEKLMATTYENPLVLSIPWSSQLYKLVLQPGPEEGKDAMISNLNPDKNFGDHKYFEATFLSEPILTVMRSNRSLIWFNTDSLPISAIIKKVELTLTYNIPIPFDSIYYASMNGPTSGIAWYGAVLQQIVEPWDEYKVTWNTAPKTVEANQVFISPFIRNVNFIEVDVTRLFVSPSATDQAVYPNYGMLFRLWPTDQFPGFRFGSSDYPDARLRPRLTIYYIL